MPWREASQVSLRREFVALASHPEAEMSALCREFGVSRKTGYKWLRRFKEEGTAGLEDLSRRPCSSPHRTGKHIEEAVCDVRLAHPTWSGYKIRHVLLRQVREGHCELRPDEIPAASTCTQILHRHDLIDDREPQQDYGWQRFEKARPNELWQMDFKGNFGLESNIRVYPLTVLDDHSRYSIALKACGDQKLETVQGHLSEAFDRYGLPDRILADNGAPWGAPRTAGIKKTRYTQFTLWLYRLGVSVSFSRPYHPQTLGKDERFHRTLGEELLSRHTYRCLDDVQAGFDVWRQVYNLERPHEALGMQVPADRYQPSTRPLPKHLMPIEYGPNDTVRKVNGNGTIGFKGRLHMIGPAFQGLPVALRPTTTDDRFHVFFGIQKVIEIDLQDGVRYPYHP